jgi:hypothetical protein
MMPTLNRKIGSFMTALCACFISFSPAAAQQQDSNALGKIKHAQSAVVDCSACPRALAKAGPAAREALASWNRFQIVDDPKQADLIFMFSGNPYLGDYLTRKGPDERPVKIDSTILTIIDSHTGAELWSDYRHWGSWRVSSATKDLIDELRSEMEVEAKKWTLDEVLACSGAPAYRPFAFSTADAALANPNGGVKRVDGEPNRLSVNLSSAPDFCRRVQLVIGHDNKINAFEVVASESDGLDVTDILAQADRFQFTSGKDAQTQRPYFIAQSRERKIRIRFDVQGRRMALSGVVYSY